jgi:hypothetical protein
MEKQERPTSELELVITRLERHKNALISFNQDMKKQLNLIVEMPDEDEGPMEAGKPELPQNNFIYKADRLLRAIELEEDKLNGLMNHVNRLV